MKRLIIILIIIALSFGLGWWANEMQHFADGVVADGHRTGLIKEIPIQKDNKLAVTDCETLKTIFTADSTNNSDTISFLTFKKITGFSPERLKGQDTLILSGYISNSSFFKNCKSFSFDVVSKNNSHRRLYILVIEIDNNCNILRYQMQRYLNQETGRTEMFDFFVKSDSLEKIIIDIPTADKYTFEDYQALKKRFMTNKR